ncbi:MAG: L-lactate permease [Thermoanaerobacterales bacterium]|nr:L-lactate permease [Thermoanaerobacterales bacterium]
MPEKQSTQTQRVKHKSRVGTVGRLRWAPALLLGGVLLWPAAWAAGAVLFEGTRTWTQAYAPVAGSVGWSSLAAALPIVIIFVFLAGLRRPALTSALLGLLATGALAVLVWGMPARLAVNSALFGMLMAVFPILWTLLNAVWIFNMLVDSGYFDVLKRSLYRVTRDRRLQTLLIGFGFTTLLEAIAAFGAPIAIVAGMLVGFGFPPMLAAVITLLSDTTIASWGTQGMPVMVLNSVTDLDIGSLAAVIGLQTPVATALFPPVVVLLVAGWKGLREVWPAAGAMGLAYLGVAVVTAFYTGPYIVGIAASLAAIATLLAILRFWSPRTTWLLDGDGEDEKGGAPDGEDLNPVTVLRAWSPYLLLVLVVGLVNSTTLKIWLARLWTVSIPWPGLHNAVMKTAPVTAGPEPYAAVYSQPVLAVGGTLVLAAGILAALTLGVRPSRAAVIYALTLRQLLKPGGTIVMILGIAYLMNYSGMTYTIGLAFASTGFWFPMATVLLGMVGCTLAGSVAASNALFGNLAVVGGQQLGLDPTFAAATLSSGGTMGKAVAFQDIVIATAALKLHNKEGELIRRVFWISVFFAVFLGALAMAQQHWLPALIR